MVTHLFSSGDDLDIGMNIIGMDLSNGAIGHTQMMSTILKSGYDLGIGLKTIGMDLYHGAIGQTYQVPARFLRPGKGTCPARLISSVFIS
jgi:hypothetical protein